MKWFLLAAFAFAALETYLWARNRAAYNRMLSYEARLSHPAGQAEWERAVDALERVANGEMI